MDGPPADTSTATRPGLPPGRPVELPGRGTTFVREIGDPSTAPTVVLLHGWTATADLNFFRVYDHVARDHHVLAIDHRGHGRGIRSRRHFRLADCADDVAALLDHLGIASAIPIGYSMGGTVAQLLWHRHPERTDGLVLCATSRNFRGTRGERLWFGAMAAAAAAARLTPGSWRAAAVDRWVERRVEPSPIQEWVAAEFGLADARMVAEAGASLGRFSSHEWVADIDVPAAVVVTQDDRVVPPERQRRLAESIPGATTHPVRGDHGVCIEDPAGFGQALLDACRSVTSRL